MTVIGIDIGGSTTKIVGFTDKKIIKPMQVKANDPITALYGAFGRYLSENSLSLSDISEIRVTGVGATYLSDDIYNIKTVHVSEFEAIGLGGLYLSEIKDALVISMGTGTALVHANENVIEHIGGTGVGGGTLLGLSSKLLGIRNFDSICTLAETGDLSNIDLYVGDISRNDAGVLNSETTASNFGKISDYASKNDIAAGLINLVFQTIGMLAVFAGRSVGTSDIVLCGNLTTIPDSLRYFNIVRELYGVNIILPQHAEFATAIGAALINR